MNNIEDLQLIVDDKWVLLQAAQDLEDMTLEEYITQRLNNNLVGWNHPVFDTWRRQQQEQDDYIKVPIEVEEGVLECIKCKSKRVFSTSVQTRAADEPMTTIAHCTKCGSQWTQNS